MEEVRSVVDQVTSHLNWGAKEDRKMTGLARCVVTLAHELDKLKESRDTVVAEKKSKKVWQLTDKERKFMDRFGWEMEDYQMIKRDVTTGKVLAHEGDETWVRDLKVAGE